MDSAEEAQTVRTDQVCKGRKATYLQFDSLKQRPLLEEGDLLAYRMDSVHRTEWPGTFSQRRGFMGLRAVRGADRVDVLETLLAGAYSKFKTWPKDKFQPWGVICGLVLSTFRYEASLSEISVLAANYRKCDAH